jgi:hypothetical protein
MLNDPTLALIARFIVKDFDSISLSEETFLKSQYDMLRRRVSGVPSEKQEDVILEWILDHAEQYREQWRQGVFSRMLFNKRCLDCPLVHCGPDKFCEIHGRWVKLLNEYVGGKINSLDYVNDSLQLLNANKDKLKVSSLKAN